MTNDLYYKIPRRVKIILIFIAVILAAYFILSFSLAEPKIIPQEFLAARREASSISQEIVSLSSKSPESLVKISELDRKGDYADALILITQELERNKIARDKAIELSRKLEIMARNLSKISPFSAGQIALEAISSETALISRLISYNDYLVKLLEVLREKFLSKGDGDGVSDLITKINEEVDNINALDKKFADLMGKFDLDF